MSLSMTNGRGRPTKTPERLARCREMRDAGALMREIAEELGISVQTVNAWLHDPDGAKLKARKDGYRGVCAECGSPTDGSAGPDKAPTMCADCIRWTPEECIAAVDRYFEQHGRSPLSRTGHGVVPHVACAKRLFGGWNEMLLKAGLPLNLDRRPETQADVEAMLRDGMSAPEVAEQFGWTPAAVHQRLKVRGLTVEGLRRAA